MVYIVMKLTCFKVKYCNMTNKFILNFSKSLRPANQLHESWSLAHNSGGSKLFSNGPNSYF